MDKVTREYFDEKAKGWIAESYDSGPTIAHTRLAAILELKDKYVLNSVMDVGCGDGRFLKQLGAVKVRTGIDYSAQMIELARAANPEIRFARIDLNAEEDLKKLDELGAYDFITMLGVVHYLSSPLKAIRGLSKCSHEQGRLVVSFRNRLLNASPSSKYHASPLNQANIKRLDDEILLWSRISLEADDLMGAISGDPVGQSIAQTVSRNEEFEGVTDNHWNPEGFEHWRQFTPLDAILLMNQAGLAVERVVPLINEPTDYAPSEAIARCSSFILVAKHEG